MIFYTLAPADATDAELKKIDLQRQMMLTEQSGIRDPVKCSDDRHAWYPQEYFDDTSPKEKMLSLVLADVPPCGGEDKSDNITIKSLDRVALSTRVDRRFGKEAGAPFTYGQWLPRIPEAAIYRVFDKADEAPPVFLYEGRNITKGAVVRVSQTLALDATGNPYCIRLTVRRGDAVWSRAVRRPKLLPPGDLRLIDKYGHSRDPNYWAPTTDATDLAYAFAKTIGFDH